MPSTKKLCERSDATLGDILDNPDRMVTPSDLASSGIVGSYSTIKTWIEKGWLPEPHRLPNGQKYWTGGQIADALGHQPVESNTKPPGAANQGHGAEPAAA